MQYTDYTTGSCSSSPSRETGGAFAKTDHSQRTGQYQRRHILAALGENEKHRITYELYMGNDFSQE